MKKLILTAVATSLCITVLAQGTVVFSNRSAGGTSHVWAGGTAQYQGNAIDYPALGCKLIGTVGGLPATSTFAQLLGAPGSGVPESTFLPGLPTTTFRTGGAAGNVALVTATFQNIPPDAPFGTFQMVAWDNASGLYPTWTQASPAWQIGLIAAGRSAPFTVASIGGTVNTPPNLEPALESFNIWLVPEPTAATLLCLGVGGILIFRRRK
jgi:hypothetical protein